MDKYYLFKRLDGKVIGTRGHMARFRKQSETEPRAFPSPHAQGKSPPSMKPIQRSAAKRRIPDDARREESETQ